MAISRGFLAVVGAGLLAQPACVVTRESPAGEPRRLAASAARHPAAALASGSEFATLIRGPGERIPVNDPDSGPEPRTMSVSASEPAGPAAVGDDVPPTPEKQKFLTPPPPDPPLVAAVRAYIDDRPELAVEHLKALDRPNQELMLQLIPLAVQGSKVDFARPTELGTLAEPLEAVTDSLAARGPLRLEKACFCRAVRDFGKYEPYPDRHTFRPGSVVGLYAELKNVRSEPTAGSAEGDGYATQLAVSIQVVDANGAAVELPDKDRRPVPVLHDTRRDFTRSPIRDCFVVFWLPVPSKPGAYAVRFEVREPSSGRSISRTLSLRVGG